MYVVTNQMYVGLGSGLEINTQIFPYLQAHEGKKNILIMFRYDIHDDVPPGILTLFIQSNK